MDIRLWIKRTIELKEPVTIDGKVDMIMDLLNMENKSAWNAALEEVKELAQIISPDDLTGNDELIKAIDNLKK